jgi:hypothetical protein
MNFLSPFVLYFNISKSGGNQFVCIIQGMIYVYNLTMGGLSTHFDLPWTNSLLTFKTPSPTWKLSREVLFSGIFLERNKSV